MLKNHRWTLPRQSRCWKNYLWLTKSRVWKKFDVIIKFQEQVSKYLSCLFVQFEELFVKWCHLLSFMNLWKMILCLLTLCYFKQAKSKENLRSRVFEEWIPLNLIRFAGIQWLELFLFAQNIFHSYFFLSNIWSALEFATTFLILLQY